MLKNLLFLMAVVLIFNNKALSQSQLDGLWVKLSHRTLTGADFPNTTADTIGITSNGKQLIIAKSYLFVPGQPDSVIVTKVIADGKPTQEQRADGRFRKLTVTSSDAKHLAEQYDISEPGVENTKSYSFHEEWTLGDNGILTIIRTYKGEESAEQDFVAQATYERRK